MKRKNVKGFCLGLSLLMMVTANSSTLQAQAAYIVSGNNNSNHIDWDDDENVNNGYLCMLSETSATITQEELSSTEDLDKLLIEKSNLRMARQLGWSEQLIELESLDAIYVDKGGMTAESSVGSEYDVKLYLKSNEPESYYVITKFRIVGSPSLKLDKAPSKVNYIQGETFSSEGTKVLYTNENGEIIDVTPECTFSLSGELNTVGTQTLTISYGDYTVSQLITVSEKVVPVVLTGIEVTKRPSKVDYYAGEKLDANGMVISAIYSDGSKQVVSDYKIEYFGNTLKEEAPYVIISYKGFSTQLDLTVTYEPIEESQTEDNTSSVEEKTPDTNTTAATTNSSKKPTVAEQPEKIENSEPVVVAEPQIDNVNIPDTSTKQEPPVAIDREAGANAVAISERWTQESFIAGSVLLVASLVATSFAYTLTLDFHVIAWYKKKKLEALRKGK